MGAVERIVTGWRLTRIADAVIARKSVTPYDLARSRELGASLAAGLALGIW